MSDISVTDKNFAVKTNIDKNGIRFYNIDEAPFEIYGVFREGGKYRRMPENVAKKVSDGVHRLHTNTSGGRVRFVTDSEYVAIYAKMDGLGKMPHCAFTASMGFDMYDENKYIKTFVPPRDMTEGYESIIEMDNTKERLITINFPLYSNVSELYIGLSDKAIIKKAPPYKHKAPIVYYGSSITQGACASRPGRCYTSIISREFDCDHINLGFAGCAKAEDEIIEYIKTLDMSVFVLDYDHNAQTMEHLQSTHEKMFKAVRSVKKDIPIIIMSRPTYSLSEREEKRLQIIRNTYENAIKEGDRNVYLIDGRTLMSLCGDEGTADSCHPTDFGFASIAKALGDVIRKNKLL